MQDANYEYKLATDPSLAKESGKYYVSGSESCMPAVAKDQKFRKRL